MASTATEKNLSDEYTFARFNLSYSEFIASGKAKLPEEDFRDAIRRIAEINLNAQLIIAGFLDGTPEIYHTDGSGTVKAAKDFAVIGEGEYLAQSVLLRREQHTRTTLHATLYNVYEAKRYSEAVGSVGKQTSLYILASNGTREMTSFNVDDQLEEAYKKYGPRKLPSGFKFEGAIYFSEETAQEQAEIDAEIAATNAESSDTGTG